MQTTAFLFCIVALLFCVPAEAADPEKVVNLGRTSLASVSATSVNGNRSMNNRYYGIVNAFDDGNNRHNNVNYTYWLANYNEPGTYAEVDFDVAVKVSSIVVEESPPFSVQFVAEDGTERSETPEACVSMDPPAAKTRRIRLTFKNSPDGSVKVNEIRIMGVVPPGTEHEVQKPRVKPTRRNLELVADDAFKAWLHPYLTAKKRSVRETQTSIVFVYFIEDVPVVRVTIDRKSGAKKVESFSREKPIADVGAADTRSQQSPKVKP